VPTQYAYQIASTLRLRLIDWNLPVSIPMDIGDNVYNDRISTRANAIASVGPFPLKLLNRAIFDLDLLHVYES